MYYCQCYTEVEEDQEDHQHHHPHDDHQEAVGASSLVHGNNGTKNKERHGLCIIFYRFLLHNGAQKDQPPRHVVHLAGLDDR